MLFTLYHHESLQNPYCFLNTWDFPLVQIYKSPRNGTQGNEKTQILLTPLNPVLKIKTTKNPLKALEKP